MDREFRNWLREHGSTKKSADQIAHTIEMIRKRHGKPLHEIEPEEVSNRAYRSALYKYFEFIGREVVRKCSRHGKPLIYASTGGGVRKFKCADCLEEEFQRVRRK